MTDDREPENDELSEELRRSLKLVGVRATARRFGLHPQTVLAIAAGAPVHNGSMALARERLRMTRGDR